VERASDRRCVCILADRADSYPVGAWVGEYRLDRSCFRSRAALVHCRIRGEGDDGGLVARRVRKLGRADLQEKSSAPPGAARVKVEAPIVGTHSPARLEAEPTADGQGG
jgi:hypothetical protein